MGKTDIAKGKFDLKYGTPTLEEKKKTFFKLLIDILPHSITNIELQQKRQHKNSCLFYLFPCKS